MLYVGAALAHDFIQLQVNWASVELRLNYMTGFRATTSLPCLKSFFE